MKYIGETSINITIRNKEHAKDILNNKRASHMREHCARKHQQIDHPEDVFRIQVIKKHKTVISRKIHKAVSIARSQVTVLNFKS